MRFVVGLVRRMRRECEFRGGLYGRKRAKRDKHRPSLVKGRARGHDDGFKCLLISERMSLEHFAAVTDNVAKLVEGTVTGMA